MYVLINCKLLETQYNFVTLKYYEQICCIRQKVSSSTF